MPEPANAQVSGIGESIVSPEDGARRCWAVAGRFRMPGLRPCLGCSAGIS